jgi:FkbM family methyltransferase
MTEKLRVIAIKYVLYLKNVLIGIHAAPRMVRVFKRPFFYGDVYGIASLQRVYCEHYRLLEIIPKDAVIVDVGANIGQFTFFCQHYLKARKVLSIEPLPECYELLIMNSQTPQTCLPYAVSNDSATLTMHVPDISTQLSTTVRSGNFAYGRSMPVAAKMLDTLLTENNITSVDLLKIDTEGSEYDVLLSTVKTLPIVKIVSVEMSIFRDFSGSMFTVGKYLEEQGFQLVQLSIGGKENPSTAEGVFRRDA